MLDQPFNGLAFVSKQSCWNSRPGDSQVNVSHHASERAALDKERKCQEAVYEGLTGVMMPRISLERLRRPYVDEERATLAGSLSQCRREVRFGVVERLIRAIAASDGHQTIVAEMDICCLGIGHGG